jgi:nicotinamidase/pyrazinamidase
MKALIIVDVQNDFLPGGALAVPNGNQIIPVIQDLVGERNYDLVVASRDFHPENHCSFMDEGGIWPVHCVRGTEGAELHPEIIKISDQIIDKAVTPDQDFYSAFGGTNLAEALHNNDIKEVDVVGLATDYCVKETVLDAAKHGFIPTLVKDACRAVCLNQNDEDKAIEVMYQAGAYIE